MVNLDKYQNILKKLKKIPRCYAIRNDMQIVLEKMKEKKGELDAGIYYKRNK